MSEKSMRGLVVRALSRYDAVAVENPAFPGTPDVNHLLGWIELKELPRWPRIAPDRPVLVPHFTPQQRVWLIRRTFAGGLADLLLKAGQEWLLFDGKTAAEIVGKVPQAELRRRAVVVWASNSSMREFICECLFRRSISLRLNGSPSSDAARAGLSPPPPATTRSG